MLTGKLHETSQLPVLLCKHASDCLGGAKGFLKDQLLLTAPPGTRRISSTLATS